MSIPSTPPFITGRIMDHLRHVLSTAESDEEAAAAVESEVTTTYPPRHLQSMCALWQCLSPGPQPPLIHLALFTFLLFDTVAVNALRGSKVDEDRRSNDNAGSQEVNSVRRVRLATENAKEAGTSSSGPVARAVRLVSLVYELDFYSIFGLRRLQAKSPPSNLFPAKLSQPNFGEATRVVLSGSFRLL